MNEKIMNALEKVRDKRRIRKIDNSLIRKLFFPGQQLHTYGLTFEESIENAFKMMARKPEKEREYKTLLMNVLIKKINFTFPEKILQYINWIYFIPMAILFYLFLPDLRLAINERSDMFASIIPHLHTSVLAYFIILCILSDMFAVRWKFCVIASVYAGIFNGLLLDAQLTSESGFFYDFCIQHGLNDTTFLTGTFFGIPVFYIGLTFLCYWISHHTGYYSNYTLYEYSAPDTFRNSCYDPQLNTYCVDFIDVKQLEDYCKYYVPEDWKNIRGQTFDQIFTRFNGEDWHSITYQENFIEYQYDKATMGDIELFYTDELYPFFEQAFVTFHFNYKKGENQ